MLGSYWQWRLTWLQVPSARQVEYVTVLFSEHETSDDEIKTNFQTKLLSRILEYLLSFCL